MSLNLEVSYLDSAYTYSGNMPQSIGSPLRIVWAFYSDFLFV